MRQSECSISVIQDRYPIGSGTVQLILKRYKTSGFTLEQLKTMEPSEVELLFYPPENLQRQDIPIPDFKLYNRVVVHRLRKFNENRDLG